ncbi:hypothetical protein V6N12_042564 [Hibiscus sabdariffa]|uniref:Reverse transcriptase zinc-binding domain-containing protein n=1 Tax=Hibiscus sabdariffa TaxID=183260 RepID=A0ABR2EIV8_9ROSI
MDEQWDTAQLLSLFPADIVPNITGIFPRSSDISYDSVVWSGTPLGAFSLASAYEFLPGGSWDIKASDWNQIWSLPVQQRVRVFLWLGLRDSLLTNTERAYRGLIVESSCPICGCYRELVLHVLRDCFPIRLVWQRIFPAANHHSFSCLPLAWKRRNDYVFSDVCLSFPEVFRISLAWASHFTSLHHTSHRSTNIHNGDISRHPPSVGLQVARSQGIECLQVQTDCDQATRLLCTSSLEATGLPSVRAIDSLCNRGWLIELQWIFQ